MVKVLIYSSKEIYDKASFVGRAEAHIIAYRESDFYRIIKNRTSQYMSDKVVHYQMSHFIGWAEHDEWNKEMELHKLKEKHKDHPIITLMKNGEL